MGYMMGQYATEDEILQAIYKSGYLMEHEIADMLERHSYHVVTNSAFKDIETEKSREIDVLGIKRILHDDEHKIDIFINLICECKTIIITHLFSSVGIKLHLTNIMSLKNIFSY
jgi:hypothetical protein